MDVAALDRALVGPTPHQPATVGHIGAQVGDVGERHQQVAPVGDHPVRLAEHASQVVDERERGDGDGEVDLVGSDERELGRMALVELAGHAVPVSEGAGRLDLGCIDVGGHHAGTAGCEPDRVVARPAPEHEHAPAVDVADQAMVELGTEPRTELHVVEGSVGARIAGVVQRHGHESCPDCTGPGGTGTLSAMKLGLTQAAGGGSGGIDYRLAREATLQAWRSGDLTEAQVCDAQRELRRNAEFCGTPAGRPCPVCAGDALVEVTYVFGPRLPRHGRCVTSDKEMARIDARKAAYQGYVVEVCTDCGWNHLTRSRALGGRPAA